MLLERKSAENNEKQQVDCLSSASYSSLAVFSCSSEACLSSRWGIRSHSWSLEASVECLGEIIVYRANYTGLKAPSGLVTAAHCNLSTIKQVLMLMVTIVQD